jgi:L-malate glycosyltransferase
LKITIALPVYHNFPIGGYHVHYQYANLLARKGHQVSIVFPRYLRILTGVAGRLRTVVEPALWAMFLRLRNRPLIGSFVLDDAVHVRLVRDLYGAALPDADVLIATGWQTAEAMARAPARCGRKFYIVYDYEFWITERPEIRARIERTYAMGFTMVATSSVVAETIRAAGGAPAALIQCGLDFNVFGIDIPPETRQPLSVGFPVRREWYKGTSEAIAAAVLLRERFGDRLRAAAFGYQPVAMPPWIEWHHYPSQRKLREFYNAQSVFILPSRCEGWGLPAVEAMACGAALVTADNGGCRDYAIDGETAVVVPANKSEYLADATSALFRDDAMRARLARDGNRHVQRFTWAGAVDRLENLLLGHDQSGETRLSHG